MHLEFKSIAMASGEIYGESTGEVPDDFLDAYMPCNIGNDTIYVALDAIISFQLKEEKPKFEIVK